MDDPLLEHLIINSGTRSRHGLVMGATGLECRSPIDHHIVDDLCLRKERRSNLASAPAPKAAPTTKTEVAIEHTTGSDDQQLSIRITDPHNATKRLDPLSMAARARSRFAAEGLPFPSKDSLEKNTILHMGALQQVAQMPYNIIAAIGAVSLGPMDPAVYWDVAEAQTSVKFDLRNSRQLSSLKLPGLDLQIDIYLDPSTTTLTLYCVQTGRALTIKAEHLVGLALLRGINTVGLPPINVNVDPIAIIATPEDDNFGMVDSFS